MAVKKTTAIVINPILERLHCRLIADVRAAWISGSFWKSGFGYGATANRSIRSKWSNDQVRHGDLVQPWGHRFSCSEQLRGSPLPQPAGSPFVRSYPGAAWSKTLRTHDASPTSPAARTIRSLSIFRSPTQRVSPCRCSGGLAANLLLRGAVIVLGSSRRQSSHREKRQNNEPLIVVINGDKRPLGGDRYVVPVWHRILTAIRHPERERRPALYGRLNLASRHGLPLRRQACVRKRFLLANAELSHGDMVRLGMHP
jgi:hypothetical protein